MKRATMTRNELCNATLEIIQDENTTLPEKLSAAWKWIEVGYTIQQASQFLFDMVGERDFYSCMTEDVLTAKMQYQYLRHLDRALSRNGIKRPVHVVSHKLPHSLKNSLAEMWVQSQLSD